MTDTQLKTLKDALSKNNGKDTRAFSNVCLSTMHGFKTKGEKTHNGR